MNNYPTRRRLRLAVTTTLALAAAALFSVAASAAPATVSATVTQAPVVTATVRFLGVINLTATRATVLGTVNANGVDTNCVIGFGTVTSTDSAVPCSPNPITGTTNTGVFGTLTGLTPNTTYHVQIFTLNREAGHASSQDVTFRTPAS